MYDSSTFSTIPWKNKVITSINIELGVTYIGSFLFDGMNDFSSLILPASVSSIGQYAFYECKGLQEVIVSGDLSYVGSGCFGGCTWHRCNEHGAST